MSGSMDLNEIVLALKPKIGTPSEVIDGPGVPTNTLAANAGWQLKASYPALATMVGDASYTQGATTLSNKSLVETYGGANTYLGASGMHSSQALSNSNVTNFGCQHAHNSNNLLIAPSTDVNRAHTLVSLTPDGKKWKVTSSLPGMFRTIRFLNSAFYICTTLGLYRSTDGVTWTRLMSIGVADIAYGASTFAILLTNTTATKGIHFTTDDFVTITPCTTTMTGFMSIGYIGAKFFATLGNSRNVWNSTDANTWTDLGTVAVASYSLGQIFYANGYAFIIPNSNANRAMFYYTTDGVTFTAALYVNYGYIKSIFYDAATTSYYVISSSDGSAPTTLQRLTSISAVTPTAVGTFIAGGYPNLYGGSWATVMNGIFISMWCNSNAQGGSGVWVRNSIPQGVTIADESDVDVYGWPLGGQSAQWGSSNGRKWIFSVQYAWTNGSAYYGRFMYEDSSGYFVTARNAANAGYTVLFGTAFQAVAVYHVASGKWTCLVSHYYGGASGWYTQFHPMSAAGVIVWSSSGFTHSTSYDIRIYATSDAVGVLCWHTSGLETTSAYLMGPQQVLEVMATRPTDGFPASYQPNACMTVCLDGTLVLHGNTYGATDGYTMISYNHGRAWSRLAAMFIAANGTVTTSSVQYQSFFRINGIWYAYITGKLYAGRDFSYMNEVAAAPVPLSSGNNLNYVASWIEVEDGLWVNASYYGTGGAIVEARGYGNLVVGRLPSSVATVGKTGRACKITLDNGEVHLSFFNNMPNVNTSGGRVVYAWPYDRTLYFQMPLLVSAIGKKTVVQAK